ncbi:hypothetical protein I541_5604 [Mycobacteroides abscessus]|nr:hypothetical protein I541_5604 [Mycobacteroides abscessus]
MKLRDDAGQPVAAQHLCGDDLEVAVVGFQGVQRRGIGSGAARRSCQ